MNFFKNALQIILLLSVAAAELGSRNVDSHHHEDIPLPERRTLGNESSSQIRLAGIFDLTTYDWGFDVFEVTVQLINEGLWDILPPGTRLVYDLEDAKCDETTAARAYWDLKTDNYGEFLNGIIGCRCSGATASLARISGLEGVPQVSFASNAASLSDSMEFPFFSRLVAPNNNDGEVGALVAMLREFGWERVSILSTDTEFSKDLVNEFRQSWIGEREETGSQSWNGEIAHSDTITFLANGTLDMDAVQQALENVPTDEPTVNSRIIFLAAHSQHAFPILEHAQQQGFQPDTIWVGPSSWVARKDYDDFSWLSDIPGYLGVSIFRNRDQHYKDFMAQLQSHQRAQGKAVLEELPTFAPELVDSIRALSAAIVAVDDPTDGQAVIEELRDLSFNGVSGHVEFTVEGDRKNPKYSMFNSQSNHLDSNGKITWTEIGTISTKIGTANFPLGIQSVCYAQIGCGLSTPPDDTYPVEPIKLPTWIVVLISLFGIMLFIVAVKYWRSRRSKREKLKEMEAELEAFRKSVVGMRAAERKYVPQVSKKQKDVEEGTDTTENSGAISVTPTKSPLWIWQETDICMDRHDDSVVYGDRKDCWIKYNKESNKKLEDAYQSGKKKVSPLPEYMVHFSKMEQVKESTGFTRKVQRVMVEEESAPSQQMDLSDIHFGTNLPNDLKDEPQMILVEGDMIQISKEREDGWAFGTKLHHADEATSRRLLAVVLDNFADADESNVFPDTGWFQVDHTRVPTMDDISRLKEKVGGASTGALVPPDNWDEVVDPTVVQHHDLPHGEERDAVEKAFMSTLHGLAKVVKIERIQNLAMWQSYIVKRQTICYRETGHEATDDDSDGVIQKALDRFERKWLFHGTDSSVMNKILQQGFNRSFCGKNATAYGKGVYFARDASYSSHPIYAVPDHKGHQYMMACRVVVGEYCRGKHDALTPDIRDHGTLSLYDSTVDNETNPSIYVTYHDSQAYPEYLITFKSIGK